jgi:hypothetical protein
LWTVTAMQLQEQDRVSPVSSPRFLRWL